MAQEEVPPPHPDVRIPPPLLHLGGILVGYGVDQALHWQLPRFPGDRILALVLAGFAVLLLAAALLEFVRHRTTLMPHRAARTLITHGVFRLTRNPIYLAFALLNLACALTLASPGMLIVLVPVVWVMQTHVIAAEEQFHQQRFGADWQRYRQKVRRWI